MAAPSAVNIMRLPDSPHYDTSQAVADFGSKLIGGIAQMATEKKIDKYQNELLGVEDPKAKQEALAKAQVELQKEQQVTQANELASTNLKTIDENSRLQRILEDPDSLNKLNYIYKRDPESAKFVLDTLKTNDVMAKAALAEEAARAQQFYSNALVLAQKDEGAAKEYIRNYAQEQHNAGKPVDKLATMLTKSGDDFAQSLEIQGLMAGNVASLPEAMTAYQQAQIEIDRAKLALDRQEAGGMTASSQLRGAELELEREKLNLSQSKMSATAEKALIDAQEAAQSSDMARGELLSLAQEFEQQVGTSGVGARWSEKIAEFSGNEDQVSMIRKKYNQLKNSQVMKSLPPGVASDKDIEIAMSGFLDSTANPTQVASFLRGMSKMEDINYQYNSFKADWLSENGNTRGMLSAWKQQTEQAQPSQGGQSSRRRLSYNPATGEFE